ncbi:MAG: hypothetical protein R3C61_14955 [Bacteroidia bacterium]
MKRFSFALIVGMIANLCWAGTPGIVIRLNLDECLTCISAVGAINRIPEKYHKTILLSSDYQNDGIQLLLNEFSIDTTGVTLIYSDSLFHSYPESPYSRIFVIAPDSNSWAFHFPITQLPENLDILKMLFPEIEKIREITFDKNAYFSNNLEVHSFEGKIYILDYTKNEFLLIGPDTATSIVKGETLDYPGFLEKIPGKTHDILADYQKYQLQMQKVHQDHVQFQNFSISASGIFLVVDVPYPELMEINKQTMLAVKKSTFLVRMDEFLEIQAVYPFLPPPRPYSLDNTEPVFYREGEGLIASIFKEKSKGKAHFSALYHEHNGKLTFGRLLPFQLPDEILNTGSEYDHSAFMMAEDWIFFTNYPDAISISDEKNTTARLMVQYPGKEFELLDIKGDGRYGRYIYRQEGNMYAGIFDFVSGKSQKGTVLEIAAESLKSQPTLVSPYQLCFLNRNNRLVWVLLK